MFWLRRPPVPPAEEARVGKVPGVEDNPYQSPAAPLSKSLASHKPRSRVMLLVWLAVGLVCGAAMGLMLLEKAWWLP